jgi:cytochrome c oxidase assembly factor CtaG
MLSAAKHPPSRAMAAHSQSAELQSGQLEDGSFAAAQHDRGFELPNPDQAWLAAWEFDPVLVVLLGGAGLWYLLAYRAERAAGRPVPPNWAAGAFLAGLASLAVALLGPPDYFAAVSFAAHMVQHLLLTLVGPPLLLLGRPLQLLLQRLGPRYNRPLLLPTLGRARVRRLLAALTHPLTVLLLFNGSLLLWHHPALYQAALRDQALHELEHASFFWTALLFWWVLIDPLPRRHRLSPTATLLVLFASWMLGDLLGATLTLAREPLYPLYAEAQTPWGLSPAADQRLGGLIMWVGGGGLFTALLIGYLAYPHLRPSGPTRTTRRVRA